MKKYPPQEGAEEAVQQLSEGRPVSRDTPPNRQGSTRLRPRERLGVALPRELRKSRVAGVVGSPPKQVFMIGSPEKPGNSKN
jgi:hypothetical protein